MWFDSSFRLKSKKVAKSSAAKVTVISYGFPHSLIPVCVDSGSTVAAHELQVSDRQGVDIITLSKTTNIHEGSTFALGIGLFVAPLGATRLSPLLSWYHMRQREGGNCSSCVQALKNSLYTVVIKRFVDQQRVSYQKHLTTSLDPSSYK